MIAGPVSGLAQTLHTRVNVRARARNLPINNLPRSVFSSVNYA
jgi:hypothetical protein